MVGITLIINSFSIDSTAQEHCVLEIGLTMLI